MRSHGCRFERAQLIFIWETDNYPSEAYVKKVPRANITKFTMIQLVCLAGLYVVKSSKAIGCAASTAEPELAAWAAWGRMRAKVESFLRAAAATPFHRTCALCARRITFPVFIAVLPVIRWLTSKCGIVPEKDCLELDPEELPEEEMEGALVN